MDRQAVGPGVREDRGTDRPVGVPSWFDWPDDEELEQPDLDDDEDDIRLMRLSSGLGNLRPAESSKSPSLDERTSSSIAYIAIVQEHGSPSFCGPSCFHSEGKPARQRNVLRH